MAFYWFAVHDTVCDDGFASVSSIQIDVIIRSHVSHAAQNIEDHQWDSKSLQNSVRQALP